MKLHHLLALTFGLAMLSACFDFGGAYESYCDAGRCDDGGADGADSGVEVDAGLEDGGTGDAGSDAGADDAGRDAGADDAGSDAGADAGSDAGSDAGCGGAAQLRFISPPQTLETGACSAPVKVQLQDGCGAPVLASANVPLTFVASSTSLRIFSEATCSTTLFNWLVGAGSSDLDVHVQDPTPGTPTLQVSSVGLDAGAQGFTITCPAGQRACQGACIPTSGCCGDADCTAGGLPWVCNGSNACAPPPCTGFPANCTVYDDRTAPAASRTVTFGSSGYTPKCMRVTTSQDVTFSGTFIIHPLQQTCGPSDRMMTTTSGTTKTLRFSNFGTYGYRCANHPVFEQGSIRVP